MLQKQEKIITSESREGMAKKLVIVESPAKVKTIKKFLGSNYSVVASMGHVRDLPKSQMGIDVEHEFEPRYITIRGKGPLLASLRKEVKKADTVYLATDPDREGEAISWHLQKALKLEPGETDKKVERITFNEITKTAVKNSIKHPRELDMNLVDAQQARRVLDRLVGYGISPLLWAKVKRGLSAGRVQSVALKIICDRENEINAFIPDEYWTIEAQIAVKGEKKALAAKFYGDLNGKIAIADQKQADEIGDYCRKAKYKVADIKKGERVRKAPLPFTTSTLQQEASSVLNFSTQKTMRIAQQLYEGIDVGSGTVGLISYLRTDSTRVSDEAEAMAASYIEKNYGIEYLANHEEKKKDGKKIQDAHEAIRPTDIERAPSIIKEYLSRDQFRLYQLIWKRFTASQMSPARYNTTNVKVQAGDKYLFTVSASSVAFAGFMNVYTASDEEKATGNVLSAELSTESELSLGELEEKQHFTQPPAHYTEASLVKALEELGIGRPSTYAPTITTIIARRYVTKEQKNLYVTEIGLAVNKILTEAFPSIVDVNFTATFEALLDGVETGSVKWKTIIENFYPDLEEAVKKAEKEIAEIKIEDEVTDVVCEECGKNMVIKYGPHGKFLACPGFPDCRNTKPYFEKIGVKCPKCGNDIVMKMTKKGRRYYGCLGFPDCDFMSWPKPSPHKCPKCGGLMVEKGNKLACINEECKAVIDRKSVEESDEK
ncbi:DNA topoisomerase I [Lachnospiraceae bacterium KH1T2]|nr:DNA topoisomerase I [Lachnospiraceae bacterium KH1T2]